MGKNADYRFMQILIRYSQFTMLNIHQLTTIDTKRSFNTNVDLIINDSIFSYCKQMQIYKFRLGNQSIPRLYHYSTQHTTNKYISYAKWANSKKTNGKRANIKPNSQFWSAFKAFSREKKIKTEIIEKHINIYAYFSTPIRKRLKGNPNFQVTKMLCLNAHIKSMIPWNQLK